MIPYLIPFFFLSTLAVKENEKPLKSFINNKYFYYLIVLFFIIFIGLRYEVGCDWHQYKLMFDKYSIGFLEMIKLNFNSTHALHEIGHIFISTISRRNIYVVNLIYATLFALPFFYFCFTLERKYLSLVISYPYYIIVIGMGPIRQAACISILMLSILLVSQKKYYSHLFLSIISLIIHQFSLIFNGLLLACYFPKFLNKNLSKRIIFLIPLVLFVLIFQSPAIIRKIIFYFTLVGTVIPPAKSAIFIWLINFIPALIFIKNIDKFNINKDLKKIFLFFSLTEFFLLPIVFLNSVIAYRLLLNIFPTSIYITSKIPDLNLFKVKSEYIAYIINLFSFITLILWLKFAYHSSCWLPYKNIIFN